ncbi:MAG: hypothetical protein U1E69_21135 [Tabrizicola sp.]|uniref:hypothetical protein n=1 Tax=Tabrizicola sp. TaxID=2005166 RepID=UPI002ABBC33D|nr:hypothetical protein [Tabrizicola sp.]MDZ4089298.1 hypothetical protein [Tabrizicola sp.]
MQDIATVIDALNAQSATHTRQLAALHRAEATRSAAFETEMARLQADRAEANALREQMNGIMADMLSVLKKSGEQIRQSS